MVSCGVVSVQIHGHRTIDLVQINRQLVQTLFSQCPVEPLDMRIVVALAYSRMTVTDPQPLREVR